MTGGRNAGTLRAGGWNARTLRAGDRTEFGDTTDRRTDGRVSCRVVSLPLFLSFFLERGYKKERRPSISFCF